MHRSRRRVFLASAGFAGLIVLNPGGPANAADQTFLFDIPAEPLGKALTDFSRASSQEIVFSEEVTDGKFTPGLHGQMTAADAIHALLAGTGLTVDVNWSGVVMIRFKDYTRLGYCSMSKLSQARMFNAGVSAFALSLCAAQARAQDLETVTVTGEKYALEKSINDKRGAAVVSDGISADELGSIPEFGLGDALRYIPGLTLQMNNNREEDNFITIRGLNSDYTAMEIDGMQLVTTERGRRQVSLDVLPAVIVKRVNVDKTWAVDQVSDAAGGVTELHTRSAFDHPGEHIEGHLDYAYWTKPAQEWGYMPSGQGDISYSNTFGSNDQFGIFLLATYMRRSTSTDQFSSSWSYYSYAGSGTQTVTPFRGTSTSTSTTIKPSDSIAGLTAVPNGYNRTMYDDERTRPGVYGRIDWNDHNMFHAHALGGLFVYYLNEDSNQQTFTKVGNATFTSPTTGTFASASGSIAFNHYNLLRQIAYGDVGAGVDFNAHTHFDVQFDYGTGQWRQATNTVSFSQAATTADASTFNLNNPVQSLILPIDQTTFMNPAKYTLSYDQNSLIDELTRLPQAKAEFRYNMDSDSTGWGFTGGYSWRQTTISYTTPQYRNNPKSGTAPTLATTGVIDNIDAYEGNGLPELAISRLGVNTYVNDHLSNFTENSSDLSTGLSTTYRLDERIQALYGEVQFRTTDLLVLAGLRWETTNMLINNYQPVPFTSTTNFVESPKYSSYSNWMPSLNASYDLADDLKIRAAISQNLARPSYAQLAQNTSASLSTTADTASQTVSNPYLKPRIVTNYDLSVEWYPAPGVLASVAVFDKQIHNEIVTTKTTQENVTVPGYDNPVQLTTTTSNNVGNSSVLGVEMSLADTKFDFLPGFLSDFGANVNFSALSEDAPYIVMSDGTNRKLPALLESSKFVGNITLLYSHGPWSGSLAFNHTSKLLSSPSTDNAIYDVYWGGRNNLDMQIRYNVDDNVFVRFQAKNLINYQPWRLYGNDPSFGDVYDDNGQSFWIGVGVNL